MYESENSPTEGSSAFKEKNLGIQNQNLRRGDAKALLD